MRHFLLLISLAVLCSFSFSSISEWELKKEKHGIEVFTRAVEGQSLKESLAKTTFSGNVDEVVKLIFNYSTYPDWSPLCMEARLVEKKSENVLISYSKNNSPWPVSNRDIVLKNTVSKNADGSVKIKMSAVDGYVDGAKNTVRITYFEGYYLIEPKGDKVSVTYQAILDPAGSIPAWMANMAVVDTPFDLLYNMKEQLGKL